MAEQGAFCRQMASTNPASPITAVTSHGHSRRRWVGTGRELGAIRRRGVSHLRVERAQSRLGTPVDVIDCITMMVVGRVMEVAGRIELNHAYAFRPVRD